MCTCASASRNRFESAASCVDVDGAATDATAGAAGGRHLTSGDEDATTGGAADDAHERNVKGDAVDACPCVSFEAFRTVIPRPSHGNSASADSSERGAIAVDTDIALESEATNGGTWRAATNPAAAATITGINEAPKEAGTCNVDG